jgi:argininosuccinate synthase
MPEKVVLAYSGGLDTSVIIPWLKETYGYDVIAFSADLGQGDDLKKIKQKALKSGAVKAYVEDLRETFITEYIWPTLKAGAVYEGKYLLGTSFARPLIAKKQMEVAKKEGARAVAHGATGKGNDQVRFELTYLSIDPTIKIIAPWKDDKWIIRSREDALAFAKEKGIPITKKSGKVYSEDGNIWHLSHEGEELEDPSEEPEDRVYTISNTPEKAPDKPEYVTLEFQEGVPVKVNKKKMGALKLVTMLNNIGSRHAIGQEDMVENRLVGMKSRGIYETPGGTILYYAHTELDRMVFDRDTCHFKETVARQYAQLVYNGLWFSPLKRALDAFVDETQKCVSGTVKLKLYKGNIRPAGATSPNSLYMEKLSSFADNLELYNQKDANGFIKLFGLSTITRARKGLK